MLHFRLASAACLGALWLASGCTSYRIEAARDDFYAGRLERAAEALDKMPVSGRDRILFLMERGTVRQARAEYEQSAADFIEAADAIESAAYSVSKGAASLVVNDTTQNYLGAPFERTLLHALTALDHLAMTNWENAAVEARRLIRSLEPDRRGKYPQDAYSRYTAGFCLEMIRDFSNAALQYREADALAPAVRIDPATGSLDPETNAPPAPSQPQRSLAVPPAQLVCFVLAGRSPRGDEFVTGSGPVGSPVYAEIYAGGQYLGRSYTLADTASLAYETARLEEVRKTVKTVARIILKETIAAVVATQNEDLGRLVELALVGVLEQPDTRRWETLPRWLGVARVPCSRDLRSFDVVLKSAGGTSLQRWRVTAPIVRRSADLYVSFCRDAAAASP